MASTHPFASSIETIETPLGTRRVARLSSLGNIDRLPLSIKVLLESCLRRCDGHAVTKDDVQALVQYNAKKPGEREIPFTPGRVVLQDFTGVPAVVDLAAMRDAIVHLTGRPESAQKVNPLVPCDLVIDHSVQVDAFASSSALTINSQKEFERNTERYQFLKWGQQAFRNFRVVPPATGIVHQVNLEYLAKVVWESESDDAQPPFLFPDSLVGTDSHTTMINGLGVLGWGVGGIEAEAVMLGQPISLLIPEVIGVRLTGRLPAGATATDLVLRVTEILRKKGVVEKFVEFFGPGLAEMPLANRATIANMAPEYGATIGFFPVDEQTMRYLRLSGRDEKLIETVEKYCRLQGLWRDDSRAIEFTDVLELDLGTIEPSLAGPRRPQDRIPLPGVRAGWHKDLGGAFGKPAAAAHQAQSAGGARGSSAAATTTLDPDVSGVEVTLDPARFALRHGAVVIAAITSCTNTSNPSVMIGAGLLAKKAVERGLTRAPWVKTSLAPGSKVVTDYLQQAGVMPALESLGFHVVGYGCTTCIGNSGPLPDAISRAVLDHDLVVAAVLSGNRNFEGRIAPEVKANYLASPLLCVAYAIAGTVDIDLSSDPLGTDKAGKPVFLRDIWPSEKEVEETVQRCVTSEQFRRQYASVFEGSEEWRGISVSGGARFAWDEKSTYVQNPPFFEGLTAQPRPISAIRAARVLAKLGDSVTTDHISPAGNIGSSTPAGKYLSEHGVPKSLFNSYGARRGNDRVMTRGTFANIRVKNDLAAPAEGGFTRDFTRPDQPVTTIYDASLAYKSRGIPLVVLAGKDYGMGSSRDWAAKGTFLLGVRAVIAESFERIHRSNLVGMGVLPLTYQGGQSAASLGLDGRETYEIEIDDALKPRQDVRVTATREGGAKVAFTTTCRIDTPVEVEYYRSGGILHAVLRRMAAQGR